MTSFDAIKQDAMNVPRDKSLSAWIRELIEQDKLYKFYKTDEWLDLREAILEEQHFECQHCKAEGKYSKAVTVHHVLEVKHRPDLALSRTYIDKDGNIHLQLIALCFKCHNKVHKRFGHSEPRKQLNVERY